MTKNEPSIAEMNEVIAVFDNLVPFDDDPEYGRVYYHKGDKFKINRHTINDLKYHSSWDALMPVWSRLRLIVADHFDEDFPVEYCAMCDVWALHCEHVDIIGAHKLLYDAITWFNQQHKTNDH